MQVLCIAFCCQALSLVSVSVLLARALLKFYQVQVAARAGADLYCAAVTI